MESVQATTGIRVIQTDEIPAQQQDPPGSTAAMTPRPDHGENSYRGSGRLTGRKALITGGDSGIGRAVAIAFAREGADVAFTHLEAEAEDAAATCAATAGSGRHVVPIVTDLTSRLGCEDAVARASAELGQIDVLVNNAGYQMARDHGLDEISDERLDQVFKTNLYALFWVTRAALRHLQPGSCIINVSSIQAFEPSTTLLDYAATKAAINNFTVNLAAEVGSRGIRVNAVAPGPIWTPLQPATQDPEHLEQFGKKVPLGRPGQPAEVAPAFVFLASQADASYVSGTVLGVTGGAPVF